MGRANTRAGEMTMKWTKEKPTEEGFWFCRYGETVWVFLLTWNDGRLQTTNLFPTGRESFVDAYDGYEWAGPIPEPEDA